MVRNKKTTNIKQIHKSINTLITCTHERAGEQGRKAGGGAANGGGCSEAREIHGIYRKIEERVRNTCGTH